jgi:hypothetical protein
VQCFKQPYGSLLCGYYICEYLRESGKFNISCKELKKAQRLWTREKVTKKSITQTIADICSFISHKCVHVRAKFFNEESELVYDEKIRTSETGPPSYTSVPDLFSLVK